MSCPNLKDIPFIPCYTPRKLTIDNAKPTMKEIMYLKKSGFSSNRHMIVYMERVSSQNTACFLLPSFLSPSPQEDKWRGYGMLISQAPHTTKERATAALKAFRAAERPGDWQKPQPWPIHVFGLCELTYKTGEFFVWSDISHLRWSPCSRTAPLGWSWDFTCNPLKFNL